MSTQIFYSAVTGEVVAVQRNCRHTGNSWASYQEYNTPDNLSVRIGDIVTFVDGVLTNINQRPSKYHSWDGSQWQENQPDPNDFVLTRYQLRTELVSRGRTAAFVIGLIDAQPAGAEKEQLYVDLEDKQRFKWDDPLIILLRANLGGTEAQKAAVWIAAANR